VLLLYGSTTVRFIPFGDGTLLHADPANMKVLGNTLIERKVENPGFHKQLVTQVTIPEEHFSGLGQYSNCTLMLVETLPERF
jgi:hypothetical protein